MNVVWDSKQKRFGRLYDSAILHNKFLGTGSDNQNNRRGQTLIFTTLWFSSGLRRARYILKLDNWNCTCTCLRTKFSHSTHVSRELVYSSTFCKPNYFRQISLLSTPQTQYSLLLMLLVFCYNGIGVLGTNVTSVVIVTWYFGRSIRIHLWGQNTPTFSVQKINNFLPWKLENDVFKRTT